LRRKIQRLHDELVFAAAQYDLVDLANLAFNDGVVVARNHLARQYGARSELPRAGIELHADIRRDHRAKNGDVLLVVDT
jgi:hypothetical protein